MLEGGGEVPDVKSEGWGGGKPNSYAGGKINRFFVDFPKSGVGKRNDDAGGGEMTNPKINFKILLTTAGGEGVKRGGSNQS